MASSSIRLYLDDCVYSRLLRHFLQQAGYEVTVPADAQLAGADDEQHFAYARRHGLILITKDPQGFRRLHDRFPDHRGILVVYRDNDATRDMSHADIARAVTNLVNSGVPVPGQVHVLNRWRY